MAKRSATPKRSKSATRRTAKKKEVAVANPDAIDISSDDDVLVFNIWNSNQTELLGTIEDKTTVLHRIALIAQQKALEQGDSVDYIPIYAADLTKKYKVQVNDVAAYRMASFVFNNFLGLKKSTDG